MSGIGGSLAAGAAPTVAILVSRYLSHRDQKATQAQVGEVHTIVNSQKTEMLQEIEELKARLPDTAE